MWTGHRGVCLLIPYFVSFFVQHRMRLWGMKVWAWPTLQVPFTLLPFYHAIAFICVFLMQSCISEPLEIYAHFMLGDLQIISTRVSVVLFHWWAALNFSLCHFQKYGILHNCKIIFYYSSFWNGGRPFVDLLKNAVNGETFLAKHIFFWMFSLHLQRFYTNFNLKIIYKLMLMFLPEKTMINICAVFSIKFQFDGKNSAM